LFVDDSPVVLNERGARSLRIDAEKLDVLLNLAGEVAVAQGRLADLVDEATAAHDALAAFQDIVPVDCVKECLDLEHERTLKSEGGGVIELRGEPLPFVDLSAQLGGTRVASGRRSIVVLEHAGRRAGLDVDGLLGEVQAVIKPLGPLFAGSKSVAGSALLRDGRVALVLDVGNLLRAVNAKSLPRRHGRWNGNEAR
jgi:chemotaxis protein histidine kinase CheA